jgi:hypothetical protein
VAQQKPGIPALSVFRPPTSLGALVGAGVTLVCLIAAGALFYRAQTLDPSGRQVFPYLAGGFFGGMAVLYGYWTWACRTLSCMVDRNALAIRWGGVRQVVPLSRIERLVPGPEAEPPQIEGVSWMGHHVGKAEMESFGEVLFYSTHRTMSEVLYVETPEQTYAISVPDPVQFAQTVQANQQRGSLFEQEQVVHRSGIAAQSFWVDANARLLAALVIVAFIALLTYVLQGYPDLPQQILLRFPSLGGIIRSGDKSELLDIPRSAAGFLAVNLGLAVLLHSWERMVSYVLLVAGIGVQVLLLVAAIVAVA